MRAETHRPNAQKDIKTIKEDVLINVNYILMEQKHADPCSNHNN